jgi:hypothetical protein
MDVAGAIVQISAGGSGADADDSDSGSGCSDATKRRRHPDSIMMLPVPPLRKRGRGAGSPAAGWLRGEAETRARDARGRGSRVCRHRGGRASVGAARRPGSWGTGAGAWRRGCLPGRGALGNRLMLSCRSVIISVFMFLYPNVAGLTLAFMVKKRRSSPNSVLS